MWIFFLIFKVDGKYLETLSIYSLIQLFGFLVLLTGVLVYNEIIVLPFWGLDKHTKRKIEKLNDDGLASAKFSEITFKSKKINRKSS